MSDSLLDATTTDSWRNWAGNQTVTPARIIRAATEEEVRDVVTAARRDRSTVRAAGAGHSFTPLVDTNGTLLDVTELTGVVRADRETRRATALGGTRLRDLGALLWDAGLSLANQGDFDAQTIAGLTATGTKGSGTAFGSISSMVRGLRIVTGTGEMVDIDDSDKHLLHAAQVSLGLLGVVTQVTLDLVPAYRIRESNTVMSLEELLEVWDEGLATYRHFSLFWMPTHTSHALYGLPSTPAGHSFVKMLQEEPYNPDTDADDPAVVGEVGTRVGRAHLVYPDVAAADEALFTLEYMVPATHAREAFLAVRELMETRFPDEQTPIQLRWQKADEAYLSAHYQRDTVALSVSAILGTDYEPFLRAVDVELQQFDARPHWGKAHFLTADRVRHLYPALDQFLDVRAQFDPDGIFLNDHLRSLFEL